MPEFLDRIFGREPAKKTGTVAKERLQFILVHDRINLPPERMEAMKKEILEVIAKYVSVDNENVDIALQKRERNSLLVAEIPFLKTLEDPEYEDPDDDDERPHVMLDDDDEDEDSSEGKPAQNNVQPAASEAAADDEPSTDDEDLQPPLDELELDEQPAAEKPKPNNTPKRKR